MKFHSLKWLLVTMVIISSRVISSNGQQKTGYFPFVENWKIIDSLKQATAWKGSRDSLWEIERIELEKQSKQYAQELIKRNYITFPFQIASCNSLTSQLIFRREYNIHFDRDIREDSDNIKSHYYAYYEVMKNYLESKYGKDFFKKVNTYASVLDSMKQGLVLPDIVGEIELKRKVFLYLDSTLERIQNINNFNYPFIAFLINRKGHVEYAYIGSSGIGGFYKNTKVSQAENEKIKSELNKYKWHPATFKKKFESKEVAYIYANKKIEFVYFYE